MMRLRKLFKRLAEIQENLTSRIGNPKSGNTRYLHNHDVPKRDLLSVSDRLIYVVLWTPMLFGK